MEPAVVVIGRPDAIRLAASILVLSCPISTPSPGHGEQGQGGHTHEVFVREGHNSLQTTRLGRQCLERSPYLVGQLTYGLVG